MAKTSKLSITSFHKHHNLTKCHKHEEIVHHLLTLKQEDFKVQDHLAKHILLCIFSTLCTEKCSQTLIERKQKVLKQIEDFICMKNPDFMRQMKPIHRLWVMPHVILTMLSPEDHKLFIEITERHLDNSLLQNFYSKCKRKSENASFCSDQRVIEEAERHFGSKRDMNAPTTSRDNANARSREWKKRCSKNPMQTTKHCTSHHFALSCHTTWCCMC